MATNPVVKEDFDFKDIFPTCLYDFNTYSSKAINDDYKLDNTCSMIMMLLEPRRGISESYIAACRELVLYLDYIKTKRSSTLIKYIHLTYLIHVLHYVKEFTDDTFQKFENLNNLYNTFMQKKENCPMKSECFNKYTQIFKVCENMNNSNYCQVLNSFKIQYIQNSVNEPVRKEASELPYSSSLTHIRAAFLILTFMTFAISTTILILYKVKNKFSLYNIYKIYYTTYRSYLRPLLVNIKRLFNKKDEEYLTLLDSFEYAYNASIDNDYRI
ncbi:variable surface protein [Plasmodium gonderi]|uniref:Variable surface protein n=1 Tax=Plasmodium gonderi TaxID=77519 RepID=A0A1Y1JW05_PLAGO|nr:variable surface protein [Plasmodium gonderi]GAW84533.1 variable surface protein [Plasmodium gonderi]